MKIKLAFTIIALLAATLACCKLPTTPTPSVLPPPTPSPIPTTPVPPLPSRKTLLFGGQRLIREAVLDTVEWSSLIRDQNLHPIIEDLEGEQLDVSFRARDIEHCKQLLAEAGYPDGYTDLRIMVWPASEELIQTAQELGAYFADCGIEESIETFNSYEDAYSRLEVNAMAGESGLLLSTQIEQ